MISNRGQNQIEWFPTGLAVAWQQYLVKCKCPAWNVECWIPLWKQSHAPQPSLQHSTTNGNECLIHCRDEVWKLPTWQFLRKKAKKVESTCQKPSSVSGREKIIYYDCIIYRILFPEDRGVACAIDSTGRDWEGVSGKYCKEKTTSPISVSHWNKTTNPEAITYQLSLCLETCQVVCVRLS